MTAKELGMLLIALQMTLLLAWSNRDVLKGYGIGTAILSMVTMLIVVFGMVWIFVKAIFLIGGWTW